MLLDLMGVDGWIDGPVPWIGDVIEVPARTTPSQIEICLDANFDGGHILGAEKNGGVLTAAVLSLLVRLGKSIETDRRQHVALRSHRRTFRIPAGNLHMGK